MALQKIVSFGYKHGNVPVEYPGVVVVDVRSMFRNPHSDPTLRSLNGFSFKVEQYIRKTRNFDRLFSLVKEQVSAPGVEVAYIGCVGGLHRSVFIADLLGNELGVKVEHREI
jgi:UPF0042 nucleotide-binding protein